MKLSDFHHIAIIQTAFLGDVALALYLAEELHERHPLARISFVTTPQASELVRCATAINEVIEFDKRSADKGWSGIRRIASLLRAQKVDLVFGLQRSFRTTLIARLCGARLNIGFTNAAFSWLYSKRYDWHLSQHEVERNHSLLQNFEDVSAIPGSVSLKLPTIEMPSIGAEQFGDDSKQFVAFAPGSVWATKRWCEDYFVSLAHHFQSQGKQVLFIGGKADQELCTRLAKASNAKTLAGFLSIPQTLSLLQHCELLITNDSAPTHFAGLVGCRTVTIFGSTIPAFGFAPRGKIDVVVENKELKCRPCGLHGRMTCPLGTMECMKSVTPEIVLHALTK